jgi:BarA-like signal transduction histidine kinase
VVVIPVTALEVVPFEYVKENGAVPVNVTGMLTELPVQVVYEPDVVAVGFEHLSVMHILKVPALAESVHTLKI